MDTINALVTNIFAVVGSISTLSFVFIAFGDMCLHVGDILVKRIFVVKDTPFSKKVAYLWETLKDLYEAFREFLDKLSAYSRPRNKE